MAISLVTVSLLSMSMSSAFALISIGVDLVTMTTGLDKSYAFAWELLCYVCIAWRLMRNARRT